LRNTLVEGLGIEPSRQLAALQRAVLARDESLDDGEPEVEPRAVEARPRGVVTFLLTDIVGSTRMWENAPGDMTISLERHNVMIRQAVESNGGVFLKAKGEGDSTFSVFAKATDAVSAARDAQTALLREPWPASTPVRVRMAVHTGESVERDGDYFGRTVNRAARMRAIADASQVLVSQATAEARGRSAPGPVRAPGDGPPASSRPRASGGRALAWLPRTGRATSVPRPRP
jgi:class 3 adenylate cyclase